MVSPSLSNIYVTNRRSLEIVTSLNTYNFIFGFLMMSCIIYMYSSFNKNSANLYSVTDFFWEHVHLKGTEERDFCQGFFMNQLPLGPKFWTYIQYKLCMEISAWFYSAPSSIYSVWGTQPTFSFPIYTCPR